MTILSGNYYTRFEQNFVVFLHNILSPNQYSRYILCAWNENLCRWLYGLRCGSAVAHLQGLRFRIPPWAWMSLSCECWMLSERDVSASGRSLVQKSPTECDLSECDGEASIMRRSCPTRGCCIVEKINQNVHNLYKSFIVFSTKWRGKILYIMLQLQLLSHRIRKMSITKSSWFLLFRKFVNIYCESHKKQRSVVCRLHTKYFKPRACGKLLLLLLKLLFDFERLMGHTLKTV